jgi:hypothetical protein
LLLKDLLKDRDKQDRDAQIVLEKKCEDLKEAQQKSLDYERF